ncbi:MAG: hypothetical protein K8W52_39205 [Deltaproteobacteria bacterium]|nr:hypothetical protein [Deltaproteobacteria bacterium]
MSPVRIAFASLFALVACGASPAAPSSPSSPSASPAPSSEALWSQLTGSTAATPVGNGDALCDGDQGTLGALVQAQFAAIGGERPAKVATACQPADGGRWTCTTSLTHDLPPGGDPGTMDHTFAISYDVDASGQIDPATFACHAQG